MDSRIDLSRFVVNEEDALSAARFNVREGIIDGAVKKVAELNEKTCEQAVIVAQHEEIARLRAELEAARVDAEQLKNAITKHNNEMDAMCADKSRCGYAPYKRKCPECPTDYKIDAAIDAARGGK